MPVRKNVTYTNIITNPTTDDGYTGVLYTWVNNGITNPCTFYTPWFNSYDANDSNAKGYLLENGIYKAKSLWDDILQVGFSSYIGYSGSFVNFEDIGIRTYAQRQSVKQTSTKLYLPTKKKTITTKVLYATDDYEGILFEWSYKERSLFSAKTIYAPYNTGINEGWADTNIYERSGNVFTAYKFFGADGWLANEGHPDFTYDTCYSKNTSIISLSPDDTYPQIQLKTAYYIVPQNETTITEKLYLPVRKKNGTTQYYT